MQDFSELFYQLDWLEAQLQEKAAFELVSRAIQQSPQQPQLYARRAEILKNVAAGQEAIEDLQTALELYRQQGKAPLEYARTHSRLLMLRWSQAQNWQEIEAELQLYSSLHAPLQAAPKLLSPDPHRPLRLGYLSADFRLCSAAILLEMLFLHHPQADFELYAYSLSDSQDAAQTQFRRLIPRWRSLASASPEQMLKTIRSDQIDILIDLAGHTSLSPLPILARQAAPIQLTGLTFNGPVGQQGLWRLSDRIVSPQPLLNEQLLYLDSWIWWPEPEALPGRSADTIPKLAQVLGCAHHPGRLSDHCLASWAEILKQLPQAQLELKHRLYQNPWCRQQLLDKFKSLGLGAERIHFVSGSDYRSYLQWYQGLDLVLDPFPYHGGLVSCEALWMGLPLITLSDWMRGGESILRQLNWPLGIANSPEQYINQALELAQNAALRREAALSLRQRLQTSSITKGPRLAAQLTQSYRQLWQAACQKQV